MSRLIPNEGDPGARLRAHRPPQGRAALAREHPTAANSGSDDTLELREILAILGRRFPLIALCAVLGVGLAWYLAQRQAPVYRAQAVIRIQDPTSQMGGGLASRESAWSWTHPVQSTLEVLQSQSVLGEIVDRNGLRLVSLAPGYPVTRLASVRVEEHALPDTLILDFAPERVEATSVRTGRTAGAAYGAPLALEGVALAVPQRPEGPAGPVRLTLRDRQSAISGVASGLSASMRPQTNIVDISYTANDPALAQRIVNQAVLVFQERSALDARQNVTRRRVFLEEQLFQADLTLRSSQQALSDFRTRGQLFSSQQQAVAQQSGLMALDMRQEELRADREMFGGLLAELGAAGTEAEQDERLQALVAAPELAQNPVISSLYTQLLGYETERESITSGPFGAALQNPDVARLDQLIRTTRERLEVAVRSHMETLDARAAALAELRARTAQQLGGLPEAEAEEARLIQEVLAVQRTVEQLRDELYRAQLAEAVEMGPVDVLDLAALPLASQRASLPVMLALGLILGVLTGSGGALLAEMMNTKVRRREDAERSLSVAVVGVIPKLPGRTRLLGTGRLSGGLGTGRWVRSPARVPHDGAPVATSPTAPELVTVGEARSHQAEAFRTLRTNLLFTPDGEEIRTLVITSAIPEEGKTTTAANLAVTYAQQGLDVLLVDCDLRKPRIAELFDLPRKPGLTGLLLDEVPMEEAVRPFEAVPGLSILPSGVLPSNPTELLGGARTRTLLTRLRERFDVVLLDTPPLSGGADAAILGAAVDGVLMVIRAGETQQQAARLAAQQLTSVGARLIGSVMNDPGGEVKRYGEYYQYEYYGER